MIWKYLLVMLACVVGIILANKLIKRRWLKALCIVFLLLLGSFSLLLILFALALLKGVTA